MQMLVILRSTRHAALGILLGSVACSSSSTTPTPPPPTKTIAGIAVTGQPVKVFDHTKDKQEPGNLPDGQVTAWRESDGTVNLMIPAGENYRMRGPDLDPLTIDPHKVFSSTQSANQLPEDQYNYAHWLFGPYSLDGQTFYSLTHSEWYACLLMSDCDQNDNQVNSWVSNPSAFVSTDGGASWQLNAAGGNHVAVNAGFHWTGTLALQDTVYAFGDDHNGVFQPSRVVREGSYYYSVAHYLGRDFTQINPAQSVYSSPVVAQGYILLRTPDITSPNGWQTWAGGSAFVPVSNRQFMPFSPQQNGTALSAAPPQIVYDTTAKTYVLMFTIFGGSNAVYYTTTNSLATPRWSDAVAVSGTAGLVTDPAGPVTGFNDANFVSIIDPGSSGYNFEFMSGSPMLFFSTFPEQYGGDNLARDLYRVPLTVTYH